MTLPLRFKPKILRKKSKKKGYVARWWSLAYLVESVRSTRSSNTTIEMRETNKTNAKTAWIAKMIVRDGPKSLLMMSGANVFANSVHAENNAVVMIAGSPKIRNASFLVPFLPISCLGWEG